MKRFVLFFTVLTAFLTGLTSCNREDVGPLQEDQQTYSLTGFDQLEMGSGFDVNVQAGTTFSVMAKGDKRNLADLKVEVRNGTLTAEYRSHRNRKFTTEFIITMPTLRKVDFSGGVHSTVNGFSNLTSLTANLSGGSHGTWEVSAAESAVDLSGGSKLTLKGTATKLQAYVSGASKFEAFNYAVDDVTVIASGASKAEVSVAKSLTAEASGASGIRYKGNPTFIKENSSGASKIERD
ncbi:head GIN domain-containing protein [Larkinella harenae]